MTSGEQDLQSFVHEVRAALRSTLRAIVLYGSAAAGDFVPNTSRYDLLILVDPLGPAELKALSEPVARWHRQGQPLPTLMSSAQLRSSTDAFAIELLDMQQSRRVLYGDDPIAGLVVDLEDLRHHLERELKGNLLRLRQQYLLVRQEPAQMRDLMSESLSTFLVLMRAALRLFEPQVPDCKVDAMQRLAGRIAFSQRPFARIDQLRSGKASIRPSDLDPLFHDYVAAIEAVADGIDRFLHRQESPSHE